MWMSETFSSKYYITAQEKKREKENEEKNGR